MRAALPRERGLRCGMTRRPGSGVRDAGPEVRSLPLAVQAGLRAAVRVPSLAHCLEELLLNSLAAGCGCVAARVNAQLGRVQVADNGAGLERADLELAGARYHSSRASRPIPGDDPGAGVRRYRMVRTLEWEQIRRRVQALSLLNPGVSFTVRNDASAGGSLVVRLPKANSLTARFAQMYGGQKAAALGHVQHSSGCFQMTGFISRQGHHTKAQRHVFVNGRLVLKTRIHGQLDLLIRRHSLICQLGPCIGSRGGPDLHPVYIINVSCDRSQYDACWETSRTLIEFTAWDQLLNCLEEGVCAFLLREGLLQNVTEEQEVPQLPPVSLGPVFPRERATVQSKSVHRLAIQPETSSGDAVGQWDVTVEKIRVLGAEGDQPALQPSGTVPPSTEAPNFMQHAVDKEPTSCGISLWEEENGSSRPSKQNTPGSPESEPAEMGQPNTETVPTKGDGIYQITVAYESETSSGPESCAQESVLALEGGIHGLQEEQKEPSGRQATKRFHEFGVEMGITGLITHIIPVKIKASDFKGGNVTAREQVCHAGPVSAWNINERSKKECRQPVSGGRAFLSATRECRKAKSRRCMNNYQKIQNTSQYPQPGSLAESVITLRKIRPPYLDCGSSRNVKGCDSADHQARFHRILHMPLMTGSLDTFRREYGQDAGSSSKGAKVTQRGTDDPATKSRLERVTVIQGAENLNQNLDIKYNDTGANFKSVSLLRNLCSGGMSLTAGHVPKEWPSLISPAKNISPIDRKLPRTLAARLSRLKYLKKGQPEGENWESSSGSFADGSPPCQSPERLLQPEPESPHCSSSEPTPSISKNYAVQGGEEGWESCRDEAESTLGVNDKACCSKKWSVATNERTMNGINTPSELCLGTQSQRDGATEGNLKQSVEEPVVNLKESDSLSVWTRLLPDGTEGCSDEDALNSFAPQWLQYFNASLGKMVYVNSMTGVSSYEIPQESQTLAACTKDFTTMAVNVPTKTGFPYRCYPFRTQSLIPFLPRPREERLVGKDDEGAVEDIQLGTSNSLRSLFLEWRNPVFLRPPKVAVDVSSEQADSLAVKIHNILYPYRFTKEMISSMQVLQQVENKFIACLINTRLDKGSATGNNLLVLVDQHAAHERVRLEQLISGRVGRTADPNNSAGKLAQNLVGCPPSVDSSKPRIYCYEAVPGACGHRQLCTSTVCPPMAMSCTRDEAGLLRLYSKQLEAAGVQMEFRDTDGSEILIRKVPACFVEREATEVRRGRQPVTQNILQEFLREQIEVLQYTGRFQGLLSRTMLKVLSSQACHGAVKFGDKLSLEECRSLIDSLSSCHLPFQCAHGRPSMLPLADLDHLSVDQEIHRRPNLQKLRKVWASWKEFNDWQSPRVEERAPDPWLPCGELDKSLCAHPDTVGH
ncbi:DNA mismatch repair protein Mlh3 [Narcine bancroftii]|uniref:DNA mismatch repair protein Mlh3 n=1 Tax=Narcine bancroftii TaxID=1343680 RepID=UPI00383232ED